MDKTGWGNPDYAINLHSQVLKQQDLTYFRFNKIWLLYFYERVSINCISWLGEEFEKFSGLVGEDEEEWLSCDKPSSISKPNVIYGDFVVVHFAFYSQREKIENTTDILSQYKLKSII